MATKFKTGDRVVRKETRELGTVKAAYGNGRVTVAWDRSGVVSTITAPALTLVLASEFVAKLSETKVVPVEVMYRIEPMPAA